jgi:hypothetical protein
MWRSHAKRRITRGNNVRICECADACPTRRGGCECDDVPMPARPEGAGANVPMCRCADVRMCGYADVTKSHYSFSLAPPLTRQRTQPRERPGMRVWRACQRLETECSSSPSHWGWAAMNVRICPTQRGGCGCADVTMCRYPSFYNSR